MSLRTPPPTALATYFLVVTNEGVNSVAPVLMELVAQSSYAAGTWLQIFSGSSVPADGAVPIVAPIKLPANGLADVDLKDWGLKINKPGLVVVASSTEATLTHDAAATLDITAFVEDWESGQSPAGDTVVGDLSTGVRTLQVWAEAAGPLKMRKAIVKNTSAATDYYAVLYAVDAPVAGSKIVASIKVAKSTTVEWNFGQLDGVSPYQQDADGTAHQGCTIWEQADLTPGHHTASSDLNIKAYHS